MNILCPFLYKPLKRFVQFREIVGEILPKLMLRCAAGRGDIFPANQ